MKFKLVLEDQNDIGDLTKRHRVEVEFPANPGVMVVCDCLFRSDEKGKLSTEIEIPAEVQGRCILHLRTDKVETDKTGVQFYAGSKEVIVGKNDTAVINKPGIIQPRIILTGLAIIIAIIIGLFWGKYLFQEDKESEGKDKDPVVVRSKQNEINIFDEIEIFREQLKSEYVTFEEIREMSSWINGHQSLLVDKEIGKDFIKKIDAYMAVIEVIELPKRERRVHYIREATNRSKNELDFCHYIHLKDLWSRNRSGEMVFGYDANCVNERLRKDSIYNSFTDLPTAKEILSENRKNKNDDIWNDRENPAEKKSNGKPGSNGSSHRKNKPVC